MSGHGWVIRNADGSKARCGGPALCSECAREQADTKGEPPHQGSAGKRPTDNVVRIRRKPRPLRATYQPAAPYVVEREDEDDGSIRYMVFDHRPETYRFVCSTNDDGGTDADAKRDAEMIARGLNLLVQYGLERL